MNAVLAVEDIEIRGLPPRQAETFAHTIRGLTAKETARAMDISHRTVIVNLNNLMERFGAANRVDLLYKTVAAGVVTIKRTTQVIALTSAFLIGLAATAPMNSSDDLHRLPSRTLRVRRGREDHLTLTSLTEGDA